MISSSEAQTRCNSWLSILKMTTVTMRSEINGIGLYYLVNFRALAPSCTSTNINQCVNSGSEYRIFQSPTYLASCVCWFKRGGNIIKVLVADVSFWFRIMNDYWNKRRISWHPFCCSSGLRQTSTCRTTDKFATAYGLLRQGDISSLLSACN